MSNLRAVYVDGNSAPIFERVRFTGNHATDGGGAVAGGTDEETVFIDCTFEDNVAEGSNGGAVNLGGIATFINCLFLANQADTGGAVADIVYGVDDTVVMRFTNCVFVGNSASDGGALSISCNEADTKFTNCTLTQNYASSIGGAVYVYDSAPKFRNCIFWGNAAALGGDVVDGYLPVPEFYSCDIEGSGGSSSWGGVSGIDGGGNIDANPLFTTLPSSGGDWTTTNDNDYGDLIPQSGSPVIDVGNEGFLPLDTQDLDEDHDTTERIPFDLAGNTRINGSALDMGAYESP